MVGRQALNLEMSGSNPLPATINFIRKERCFKETATGIAGIMGSAGDFITGFIDMLGGAADAFLEHELLMLFLFAIPLGMGAIAFVRRLIKRRRG